MTDEKKTPHIVPVEELVWYANANHRNQLGVSSAAKGRGYENSDGTIFLEMPKTRGTGKKTEQVMQDLITADRKRCREAWEACRAIEITELRAKVAELKVKHADAEFEAGVKISRLAETAGERDAEIAELKAKVAELEAILSTSRNSCSTAIIARDSHWSTVQELKAKVAELEEQDRLKTLVRKTADKWAYDREAFRREAALRMLATGEYEAYGAVIQADKLIAALDAKEVEK